MISKLKPGIHYKVDKFSKKQTGCGETICATPEGIHKSYGIFNVYLPSRYIIIIIITDGEIGSYNIKGASNKMSLVYIGSGREIELVYSICYANRVLNTF